jgi:transcriptional regulator with XRE-family HTH domain
MSEHRRSPAAALFGERVRSRRRALGWSQMRLGDEAGLHFTYVSSIERGERNVSLHNILRLATALSVDPADLVGGLQPDERAPGRRDRP